MLKACLLLATCLSLLAPTPAEAKLWYKIKKVALRTAMLPIDILADTTYLYCITLCYVRHEMHYVYFLNEEAKLRHNKEP